MAIVTHPANDAYRSGWDAAFGKRDKTRGLVAYPPELPPRYNGGVLCDAWIGPCACGAAHTKAEYPAECYETPTSDMSLLPEDARTHPAYIAFVREMQGRQYGDEPLNDAWAWFRSGWDARR